MDKLIEEGVKVDAIITDPPYGTTACSWDIIIPFDELWPRLKKLRKENAPIILFGSEPFSTHLRMSNIKEFKYDWVWQKNNFSNPMLAKMMPLKIHELISVFYEGQCLYNPQGIYKVNQMTRQGKNRTTLFGKKYRDQEYFQEYTNYPKTILKYKKDASRFHPTQKPVKLLEYLADTYTNEGGLILDFTMGSGSMGVACKSRNRRFIGIERDPKYFADAEERIQYEGNQLSLF